MKRTSLLTATAVVLSGLSLAPAHATYSLVWYDEFNGTSLNTADWNYDIGTGCPSLCGWGNNELQYYRSENVAVSDGRLTITAKSETFGGSLFTSGKIHTKGKQYFTYGRMEMRAKIPTGGGMWPAFWMLPENDVYGGWAASGEIDIMEAANATDYINGTIHYGGAWPNNAFTGGSYNPGGVNFSDDFHVYAIEWEPNIIRWYVDGVLYSNKTNTQWHSDGAPGNPLAPFDQDFYVILNAAVGGNYTGCTNSGCITASLPQHYVIDYVRVYQDIPNTLPTVAITAPGTGSTLPTGNVTIDATASDSDGSIDRVEFWNGYDYLGEDSSPPYSFTWTGVSDGCYTIVARTIDNQGGVQTDQVDVTVGLGCGQLPYNGSAVVLPATIQAEDYDTGGEGVAYHDIDSGNNGGQYRSDDVDIEACTDVGGGFNVGWTEPTEYVEYTVDVPNAGDHTFEIRVASQDGGGSFRLEFEGIDKTGTIVVPQTGGWQVWTTVSTTVNLDAGVQTMRFVPVTNGFNVNYFDVVSAPTAIAPAGTAPKTALYPAYPNPFNPTTTIAFDIASRVNVSLSVYDVSGRLVRTLLDKESIAAGRHSHVWDGRDSNGELSAAGVYFYRLRAGDFVETRKLVMVK